MVALLWWMHRVNCLRLTVCC